MGFYPPTINQNMTFTDKELETFEEITFIELESDFWFNGKVFNQKRWINFMKMVHGSKATTIEKALEDTKSVSEDLYLVVKKAIDGY